MTKQGPTHQKLLFDGDVSFHYSYEQKDAIIGTHYSQMRYWIITILSFILVLSGVFVYIYSLLILIFEGLRIRYWAWGVIFLSISVSIYSLSKWLLKKYGAKQLIIAENTIQQRIFFESTNIIRIDQIVAVGLSQNKGRILSRRGQQSYVSIRSLDKTIEVPLYQFSNSNILHEYFRYFTQAMNDEFLDIFTKKRTMKNPFDTYHIFSYKKVKLSIFLLSLYTVLLVWGTISLMLVPVNMVYVNSFYMYNPEKLLGTLPQYDLGETIWHKPSSEFWFGTDYLSRDIFSRMVHGLVLTLMIAAVGSITLLFLVVSMSSISVLHHGIKDVVLRIGDSLMLFPPFLTALVFGLILRPIGWSNQGGYYYSVFIGLSFFTWPFGTRLLLSEIDHILKNEYITAVRAYGGSKFYILRKHVIPKLGPFLLIIALHSITDIIIAITALGLIGLGSPEYYVNWGMDLQKAIQFAEKPREIWWPLFFPILFIIGILFALTTVSDALQDEYLSMKNKQIRTGGRIE